MAKTVAQLEIQLRAEFARFRAQMQDAAKETRAAARQMSSSMLEARGSIMLLGEEIGVHMPRHLQRFLAGLPGVSPLLSSAFSTVAVVALGKVLIDAGIKVYEFIKKAQEAKDKSHEAFVSIQDSTRLAADELAVANDKLAITIAKLENKPSNRLKLSLDEARVAADKLTEASIRAARATQDLLAQHHLSVMGGALTGQAGTSDAEFNINAMERQYQDIVRQGAAKVRAAKTPKETEDANRDMHAALDKFFTQREADSERLAKEAPQHYSAGTDQIQQDYRDYAEVLRARQDLNNFEQQNADLSKQQQADQDKKDRQEQAKTAAAARLKDLQDQLKQQLAESKNGHEALVMEERNFWLQYLDTFAKGSDAWREVHERVSELQRQLNQEWLKLQEDARKANDGFFSGLSKMKPVGVGGSATLTGRLYQMPAGSVPPAPQPTPIGVYNPEQLKGQQKALDIADKAALAQAKQNAALENGRINWQVFTGQLSAAAAVQEKMDVATVEFDALMKRLSEQLKSAETLSIINPDALAEVQRLKDEIEKLKAEFEKTMGELQGQALANTWSAVFYQITRDAANAAAELKRIFGEAIQSLNEQLARLLTGSRASWSEFFRSIAMQFAKLGLEKLEAAVIGKITGKQPAKKDGYHVWVDNMPRGGTAPGGQRVPFPGAQPTDIPPTNDAGVPGTVPDKTGGSQLQGLNQIMSEIGSTLSSVFGKLGSILTSIFSSIGNLGGGFFSSLIGGVTGHLAGGGDVQAGLTYDVGEMGRETFTPMVSGHITPNSKIGTGAMYYIDARGANAADVEARVHRALVAAHGSAINTAYAAVAEMARRRPLSQPA